MIESTHHDGRPTVHCETAAEWRRWLRGHHTTSDGVWLIVWKQHTQRPTIPYPDTVDEALCFGWIDSRPNKLDDDRAMRWFSPRKPTSPWSRINKNKIAHLDAAGRLQPAGHALVATAKANGAWTIYDEIEDLVIPDDLRQRLDAAPIAADHFSRFPDSSKKSILWWLKSAKTVPTRAKRLDTIVDRAGENRMANHPKGRDAGPTHTN
ncbi:MAG: YdeI/OmpD-associated family protein [Actinomycetota bacterium]